MEIEKAPKYGYRKCLNCDKQLALKIKRDVERKKYCSHSCRQRYRFEQGEWSAERLKHREDTDTRFNKNCATEYICTYCDQTYNPTSSNQKWCTVCVPSLRWRGIMQRYNLSKADWEVMAESQGYKCKICKDRDIQATDHCHKTGRVRGLLCHRCNSVLEVVENEIWLKEAMAYLSI